MAFFKRYSGTQNLKLVRLERLVWVFIYGGLIALVLGYFVGGTDTETAVYLHTGGLIGVAIGVILIYVRSRLRADDENH